MLISRKICVAYQKNKKTKERRLTEKNHDMETQTFQKQIKFRRINGLIIFKLFF
jgi:hypothetical protein